MSYPGQVDVGLLAVAPEAERRLGAALGDRLAEDEDVRQHARRDDAIDEPEHQTRERPHPPLVQTCACAHRTYGIIYCIQNSRIVGTLCNSWR